MKVTPLKKNQRSYSQLMLIGCRYFDKHGLPFRQADEEGQRFTEMAAAYLEQRAMELLADE